MNKIEFEVRYSYIQNGCESILDKDSDIFIKVKNAYNLKTNAKVINKIFEILYDIQDENAYIKYFNYLQEGNFKLSKAEAKFINSLMNKGLIKKEPITEKRINTISKYLVEPLCKEKICAASNHVYRDLCNSPTIKISEVAKQIRQGVDLRDIPEVKAVLDKYIITYENTNTYLGQHLDLKRELILPSPMSLNLDSEDEVYDLFIILLMQQFNKEFINGCIPFTVSYFANIVQTCGNLYAYPNFEEFIDAECFRRLFGYLDLETYIDRAITIGKPIFEEDAIFVGNLDETISIYLKDGSINISKEYYPRIKPIVKSIEFKDKIAYLNGNLLWRQIIGNREPCDTNYNNLLSTNIN